LHEETKAPLRLLDNVSFTVLPGEIFGIMGPSGSGKTTMLMSLCGLNAPTAGQILLDGQSLFEGSNADPNAVALTGYAPQDDVVHGLLTVQEAVRYSAKLRCPPSTSDGEIEQRVTQAIRDVDLEKQRAVRIGSVTDKSLSGGQRKRVSIAMELVAEPPVLMLDEPTSGLSSHDSAELMSLLRRLADRGRTILLTIHQPSYSMFVQMDQLVLLEKGGKLAYVGPTGLDVFQYFAENERNPAAIFEQLAKPRGTSWSEAFANSERFQRSVYARAETLATFQAPQRPPPDRCGSLSVLWVVLTRGLLMKTRDKFFWIVAMIVPLFASALIAIVVRTQLVDPDKWSPERGAVEHTYLVILTIMCSFFGALCSSLEILNERAVLNRERRSGLSLAPYVMSKALMYSIPSFVHPAMTVAVFLALGQALEASFAQLYAVLVPSFLAAASAGLLLSALLGSSEGVIGLAVSYAIVQTVFSAFAPLSVAAGDNASHKWLGYVSVPITARWTLGGLVASSDLCTSDDDKSAEPDEPPASSSSTVPSPPPPPPPSSTPCLTKGILFATDCRKHYYEDHGIYPAKRRENRIESAHVQNAVVANSLLSLGALFAVGAVLKLKKR
ncbi:MAG: ATP-binding cassette domain-containing protein, partial [Myxococcales bacterium]